MPGLALDTDPRFPFYNISQEVNKVEPGEGNRVNLYLQLKTLKSDKLKGMGYLELPTTLLICPIWCLFSSMLDTQNLERCVIHWSIW